jgi:acyl-homoserine lactone acylase PvdQ
MASRRAASSIPEFMRFWAFTPQSIGAWVVASGAGYWFYFRPKLYPQAERTKAKEFTPREVEQWNDRTAPPSSRGAQQNPAPGEQPR